ncbi:hypothetical protein VIN01S_26460 [Vibrio inusitatus NBRC 102082]|uniref:Lipoprotein n=1 Tax=Vibrio inusitatus NBRC 102082 TaxID=1219070 RepID=A0A4Y3HZ49_9VIBR|nr:DUF2799 domain-containing protein [Vibrio inusitatus]GEA51842.1 hypothetical protein VIN01S_26460 [Vibrio inusitatus NBRC 102082]
MKLKDSLVILIGIIGLAGCSSTSSSSVASNDWEQRGYDLALQGKALVINEMVPKDKLELFRKGYSYGLATFCSQNGVDVAWNGVDYEDTCDDVNPLFTPQYAMGITEMQHMDWGSNRQQIEEFGIAEDYEYSIIYE